MRLRFLVLTIACSTPKSSTPPAEASAPPANGAATPLAGLSDHVWVRSDSTGRPGVMLAFLSDGLLLMDSCWETYRVAQWHRTSDSTVTWREDLDSLNAVVRQDTPDKLVLRVALRDGTDEQHYARLNEPFVCPDMKR
ncbi:MAG: hypothetical protein U0132_23090 [Gemmatimonadaceae bacterium]